MDQIVLFKVPMTPDACNEVAKVLRSGYCGQGVKVEEFEKTLQQVMGLSRRPLTVNSCTSGLDLSLHLAGVLPDDVVLSTPLTCMASNTPIVNRHAKIAWVDIDPATGCMDPKSAELVLSILREKRLRPRAIMAVDWAGRLCDYAKLRSLGLPVIQDAAHSWLANRNGEKPTPAGNYTVWSFQAIKSMTTCDGGAMLVPEEQYALAKLLRWYGLDRESTADFRCSQMPIHAGYKYHMNDVNAAIGLANINFAVDCVTRQRTNAAHYQRELSGLSNVGLPPPDPGSSWWLYCVVVQNREAFIQYIKDRGIAASPVHARNDRMPCFRRECVNLSFPLPGTDTYANHEVAIPVGWWLTSEHLDRIIDAVRSWSRNQ